QPVAVDVGEQARDRGGDLALVDPDVEVQVGVGVVGAGVDVGHHHLGRPGGDVPGGGRLDPPGALQAVQRVVGVAGVVRGELQLIRLLVLDVAEGGAALVQRLQLGQGFGVAADPVHAIEGGALDGDVRLRPGLEQGRDLDAGIRVQLE